MSEIPSEIKLVQPRHTYAPRPRVKKIGHVYLPNSLLGAASVLLSKGIRVDYTDENLTPLILNHNLVGANLLGAPYIPSAQRIEEKLLKKFKGDFTLLIGGQVVSGLTPQDLSQLFSPQTLNGNEKSNLGKVFNLAPESIPNIEDLSFIPAYNLLPKDHLQLYLNKEFSFYLSQGCQHSCSFCAAKRSVIFKEIGIINRTEEIYRNLDMAIQDFEYILGKAAAYRIGTLQVYLSNLDLFQSPLKLFEFGKRLVELKKRYSKVSFRLRGLSTARSFLKTHKMHKEVIHTMKEAGLYQVGFGIDGYTPKVYLETRKPQTVQESLDAVRIARTHYNLNPEALMVFGHNNKEDEYALNCAVKFCIDMQKKYGALPRPHIAKDIVPGNDGWLDPHNKSKKEEFFRNPMLFQNLDFTAIPSPITHPDPEFRKLVTVYYKKVCNLSNNLTQYVLPEVPGMSKNELREVEIFNSERYDI